VIVLDEEHEGAFKQESEPRYHARSLAEHIAAREACALILGSATPNVETAWRAHAGAIRRLELPDRVGQRRPGESVAGNLELPPVEIVDMRLELHRGKTSIISDPLYELIERTVTAKEQAILFLNRRGTATVVICRTCGDALTCPNCDVPVVYHQDRGRLLCHRCNHRELPRQSCPRCSGVLNYFGAGTQRVEEDVRALFPGARVARWDQDSVRRQGGHERLLRAIERREIDIVVGTQMIAKGLDLPMVTAIGVIHADTMLHLPDFRSAERTFQLLTQVAGRAGRRAGGSRVIVQTYSPDHYAIRAASRHDFESFYAEEIAFRRAHRYPPFSRLARFVYRHQQEEHCAAEAEEQSRMLARHARASGVGTDLIGPTPAFIGKLRGKHQWHVILRAGPDEFDQLLDGLPVRAGWTVDIDPQSLL
jgi:primosomal protein N' (replication factor Y) (superfamily II helicase)